MSRKLNINNKRVTNEFAFFPSYNIEDNKKDLSFTNYVNPVPREEANIEAEKGETMITPMGDNGLTKSIPKTYIIKGKKHSKGGTPLNVPDDTFLFSDYLKNKDEEIHKLFGKPYKKSGYTYAELSKPFMLNDDLANLVNPHSDRLTIETSEKNIQNKIDKLSLLSVIQESEKGFKNQNGEFDLPKIVMPFVEKTGIDLASVADPFLKDLSPVQEVNQYKTGGAYNGYQKGGGFNGDLFYNEETGSYYDAEGNELELVPQMQEAGSKPTKKKVTKVINPTLPEITDEDRKSIEYKRFTSNAKDLDLAEGLFRQFKGFKDKMENNADFRNSVVTKAKEISNDPENLGKKLKSDKKLFGEYQKLMGDDKALIKSLVDMQERNLALQANGMDASSFTDAPDKGKITNEGFSKAWKNIGFEKEPSYNETLLAQTGYRALADVLSEGKHDGLGYVLIGNKDEEVGYGNQITPIDGVWTNTTAGQNITYQPYNESTDVDEENTPEEKINIDSNVESTMSPEQIPAGWTAPDVMQLWGAANEIYADTPQQPWNAIPQAVTPNAYVMDPTNMAFNIRGQQAKAMDTVGSYTGLQAATSASSGMTGAQDITSAIANVENQNVNIINQHEANNAAIINQQNQTEASLATNLHDKWAQLKDNMQARKAAAKQNFRNAFAQGWQNSVDIGLTNATSENHAIDPFYGYVYMKQGRELKPEKQSSNVWDQIQAAIQANPNIDQNVIAKAFLGQSEK